MPEELASTDTTIETSIPETGDVERAGDQPTVEEGHAEKPAPESTPAPVEEGHAAKYGKYGDDPDKLYEGYQNLSSKLGNWEQTEQRAAIADKLLSDPKIQGILGISQNDQGAKPEESEIDFNNLKPEQIIEHFVEKKLEERFKERIDPIAQDFYQQKAEASIQRVREKYPDFDEYKTNVSEYLNDHPTLVGDEKTLIDIYKIVSYDRAQSKGEEEAMRKLREKKTISAAPPGVPSSTSQRKPTNMQEAYRMAKETL